jgi:TolB-like protein
VLPFQNMSGDLEQGHFCDGLVEDIITTLSKLAGLKVIARNSSFVYKGRSFDVREAAKQGAAVGAPPKPHIRHHLAAATTSGTPRWFL